MSTSGRHGPPEFYHRVKRDSESLWEKLVAYPDLAGPWRQLFRQVQSPRHVLSELLQNADDARATRAEVAVSDRTFTFRHDGEDFSEEHFRSICKFGNSNKRKLHTIGFRGVGFKSTFSLGPSVRLLTRSLTVRFDADRFSDPIWLDDHPLADETCVEVPIADGDRERAILTSLNQWRSSPSSLLFFNHVTQLRILGSTIQRMDLGRGPVPHSRRVLLSEGGAGSEVLLISSQEEPFPPEAIKEICDERNEPALELPPCAVQLVLRTTDPGRIFVVLPTDARLGCAFAVNAPFVQDPARVGIKPPNQSPTNRWMLERVAQLAADTLGVWVHADHLSIGDRAAAYELLPEPEGKVDTPHAEADASVRDALSRRIAERWDSLAIDSAGQVVNSQKCLAPPRVLYDVWEPEQLLKAVGTEQEHVLAREVTTPHRKRLVAWTKLEIARDAMVLSALERPGVPRPSSSDRLAPLWSWIQTMVRDDWSGAKKRALHIVPVMGSDVLFPAGAVARLPGDGKLAVDDDTARLISTLNVLDRSWPEHLDRDPSKTAHERDLLRVLELERPSPKDTLADRLCSQVLGQGTQNVDSLMKLTLAFVALDAAAPSGFKYLTRDGKLRSPHHGLAFDPDGLIQEVVPEDFASQHLLSSEYTQLLEGRFGQNALVWLRSEKSGLTAPPFLVQHKHMLYGLQDVKEELARRGCSVQLQLQRKSEYFRFIDYDFREELTAHWTAKAQEDLAIWAKAIRLIVCSPTRSWEAHLNAQVHQVTSAQKLYAIGVGNLVPNWILTAKGAACLFDTDGQPRIPCELLLRTADTEQFRGVDRFVAAPLDAASTRPLLDALGVRNAPTDGGKLLDRIRALRDTPPSEVLTELTRRYAQIDAIFPVLSLEDQEAIRSRFRAEPLVLTESREWKTAEDVVVSAGDFQTDAVAVLHPSARGLQIWQRIGIPERPTIDFILDWLERLPKRQRLGDADIRRCRAALRAEPLAIWNRSGHWLDAGGAWVSISGLEYQLPSASDEALKALFQHVRASVADTSMLTEALASAPPFGSLRDIRTVLRVALSRTAEVPGSTTRPPWLAAVAAGLLRIEEEPGAKPVDGRLVAHLRGTRMVRFRELTLTPFIGAVQAGAPFIKQVVWDGTTLWVKQGPLAAFVHGIATELARPFDTPRIRTVMQDCVDRSPGFVEDYFAAHFRLREALPDKAPEPQGAVTIQATAPVQVQPSTVIRAQTTPCTEELETEKGEPEPTTSVELRPKRGDPMPAIDPLAKSLGYALASDGTYTRPDGGRLARNAFAGWNAFSDYGDLEARYFLGQGSLAAGIELPAEVWFLLETEGERAKLVLEVEDAYEVFTGQQLVAMRDAGAVQLSASRYRIRQVTGGEA